jgi:hypothetical protein
VASSAFDDLVFSCRTECPNEPIFKLKIGGIIAAVSVPLAMKPAGVAHAFIPEVDYLLAILGRLGITAIPSLRSAST